MTSSGSVCYWQQSRECGPVWWNEEASNGCGKVTTARPCRPHPAILVTCLCHKVGLLMFHAGCNWPASCVQVITYYILHFPEIPQQSSAKQWPRPQTDCYVTYFFTPMLPYFFPPGEYCIVINNCLLPFTFFWSHWPSSLTPHGFKSLNWQKPDKPELQEESLAFQIPSSSFLRIVRLQALLDLLAHFFYSFIALFSSLHLFFIQISATPLLFLTQKHSQTLLF